MILTVVLPHWILGIEGEALIVWAGWGLFLGGLLQTLVNFPYLKKIGYRIKLIIKFTGTAITMMWKRLIPSMVGIGIREINLIADSIMASFLPIGSITALGFGNRLMQLPLGIFAISTGTAVLPLYSRCVNQDKYEELSESVRFSTVSLAYMILPVSTLIMALGGDFVDILFRQGQFDSRASLMTTQALLFYSIGLIFYSLNQTITPLFYANKDTRTPVKIAAFIVLLNISLNFVLMQFIGHRGLALSTSITAMVNYVVLLSTIKRKFTKITFQGIWQNLAKSLIICSFIFVIIILINSGIHVSGKLLLIVKDAVFAILCFVLFYLGGWIFKLDYLDNTRKALWQRLTRR
jgi:putative peptidoglycan lipid II flippase